MIPCSQEEYYYKLDNMVLSSCQYLRKIFKLRWKAETGEEWVDTIDHLKVFIGGVGKRAYKKAQSFQKSAMKSTLLENWDLALLSLVIQNVWLESKYENENSAVRTLKDLRNKLAHHSSKKIPKDEFEKDAKIFENSLLTLGMEIKEINKLIDNAGVSSSLQALELMNDLHKKGKRFLKNGEVDNALECYSNAIQIPSLLPVHLGTAYEKRAECLLSLVKDPLVDSDKWDYAFLDATKALELNDLSWAAHYLAAQCYKCKGNFSKAIRHYERSISLSPVQTHVINDYNSCKVLAGLYNGDPLDPIMLYMSLEECLEDLEDQSGRKVTKEEFLLSRGVLAGLEVEGANIAFLGHDHFYGYTVPQNFSNAFKYYSEAAKLKNTEGMYNEARCYNYGYGVKQDVHKAFQIISELAEMDRKSPGLITPFKCNIWVATAQYTMGLQYHAGIGVEKDLTEAAKWFRKGMESGNSGSAFQLGTYYHLGYSFPTDEKMAELCWKHALQLGCANAPLALMVYYLEQYEPEKAAHMFRIGREMKNPVLQRMSEVELDILMSKSKSERLEMETQLLNFQSVEEVDTKGFTCKQLLLMKGCIFSPRVVVAEVLSSMSENYTREPESWGGKVQNGGVWTSETMAIIKANAMGGSQPATQVWESLCYGQELTKILESDEKVREKRKWDILDLLYKIIARDYHVGAAAESCKQKLKNIVAKLFQETCDMPGEKDMKIRLCFVKYNFDGSLLSDDMFAVELLKEGVRRYPENVHYYECLSSVMGCKRKYKEGAFYAREGLKRFPEDADLLYTLACHLKMESFREYRPEAIAAYEQFINVAPADHRKFPEAYYEISRLNLDLYIRSGLCNFRALRFAKACYDIGLRAEEVQLPCYLPYGESDDKRFAKVFFGLLANNLERPFYKQKCILERKEYLKSPTRKSVTLVHRKNLNYFLSQMKLIGNRNVHFPNGPKSWDPKYWQKTVKKMSTVKPITLIEMNPSRDWIFENRILDLTIMDDPNPHFRSIHLVVEDENGDITQAFVYNVDRSKETVDSFQAGCRIAIINPYMRIGANDRTVGIRTDDPRCIVYLKKLESMCRFCGEKNASSKCSRCKRPYCSRECQKLDWKEFNHKLICS